MKQLAILLAFIGITLSNFAQTNDQFVCRLGFTFEMSQQPAWGYNKPVVLSIVPNSPADAAGLRADDIIESINGTGTRGEMKETIEQMLYNNANDNVALTVSNLKELYKKVELKKDCKLSTAINEKELASVYAFYSLEDVQTRAFGCPFRTTIHPKSNMLQYKTFGFPEIDPNNRDLELVINQAIREALEAKGLTLSNTNPDLWVHTDYSYNRNLNFSNSSNHDKFPTEYRINVKTNLPEQLPIYYNPLINSRQAELLLRLGIRLIDSRQSSGSDLFVVWECESNELLQSDYKLDAYARFHIPLMFMQYPYAHSTQSANYYWSTSKYNYTGISYNINNLKEIADIDRFSPAYSAGLRPGDIVERINGIKFINNPKDADNAYRQFVYKTMEFRDIKTQFTNAEGFTKCMYWNKLDNVRISEAFKKTENAAVFSYLFYFEPYVNLSGTNVITFSIVRDNQKMDFKVTPTIQQEQIFESR